MLQGYYCDDPEAMCLNTDNDPKYNDWVRYEDAEQLQVENKELKEELGKHRWIPVSEIPYKIKGWVEFIHFNSKYKNGIDGSIGGMCKGTCSNIRYILRNYTHWKPIILPEQALNQAEKGE